MRTIAVLPVKSFGRAKSRLDATNRPGLAAAMVADVLAALGQVPGLEVIVVSSEPSVDADVPDPSETGHNAAALLGIREAIARGADRVLLIPGDCPALDPAEVLDLLGTEAAVAIVPDRHGTGTNALLLTPPDVFVPSFGPGSFARHRSLAGPGVRIAELPSLMHDVDTLEDLRTLPSGAPRTRALAALAA
jgi:2-phospho-L-lactate guanylyltransferase